MSERARRCGIAPPFLFGSADTSVQRDYGLIRIFCLILLQIRLKATITDSKAYLANFPEAAASNEGLDGSHALIDKGRFTDKSVSTVWGSRKTWSVAPKTTRIGLRQPRDGKNNRIFKNVFAMIEPANHALGDLANQGRARFCVVAETCLKLFELLALGTMIPFNGGRQDNYTSAAILGTYCPDSAITVVHSRNAFCSLARCPHEP